MQKTDQSTQPQAIKADTDTDTASVTDAQDFSVTGAAETVTGEGRPNTDVPKPGAERGRLAWYIAAFSVPSESGGNEGPSLRGWKRAVTATRNTT